MILSKKVLSLTAAALVLGSGVSAAELQLANVTTANAPRFTVNPRHPKYKAIASVKQNNKSITRLPVEKGKGGKVYSYYSYYGKIASEKLSTPGTLRVSIENRATGKITSGALTLQYLTGKENRRTGLKNLKFQPVPTEQWQTSVFTVEVPPDVTNIRYLLTPAGEVGSFWEIGKVKFEYAPDMVKVSNAAVPANQAPSKWKKVPQADIFYNTDCTPAAVQTAVKIAYDAENLYVGIIADEPDMKNLVEKVTKKDGSVWNDDALGVLLYDQDSDLGYQFLTNAIGTTYDGQLKQAQAGDPYRSAPWDGTWSVKTFKNKDSWEAVFTLPWKNFGKDPKKAKFYLNFSRERKTGKANTQWNCFQGRFNEVDKFGKLDLQNNTLTRYRKVEKINYNVQRKNPVFKEVLTNEKVDRPCWFWDRAGLYTYQPASVRQKYSVEQFAEYQKKLFKAFGEAGIDGPGLPWSLMKGRCSLTVKDVNALNMQMPWGYSQQGVHSEAAKNGAQPQIRMVKGKGERLFVDTAHPEGTKAFCKGLDETAAYIRKSADHKKLVSFLHGQDEPTNRIKYLYSRSRNPGAAAELDKFEAMIRKEYGFGKYGLYDSFAAPGKDSDFESIAFWRWWTTYMNKSLKEIAAHAEKVLPGYRHFIINRNTCSGLDQLNIAQVPERTAVGCDPYPTSSRMYFGIGRGLYTTGFNVKLVRDLIPASCETAVFLQGFNYCGGVPTPENALEWTSQALKNGADWICWYNSDCYRENPALYKAAVEITAMVKDLPKLKFPEKTQTAIYYSEYDMWGLRDRCFHSVYNLYAILGEHVGSWFNFVSKDKLALADKKLLYIPRMRFTDPELTGKVKSYMENGGTIVSFDPRMWTYNIDGSAVPEREKFIGKLIPRKVAAPALKYGSKRLPLAKILHLPQKENNTIEAFDFAQLPAGAKVIATYDDGKPAIVEFSVGKGKWIFSAVQPFGNSDIALAPGAWKDFMNDLAKNINEPVNLPIWRFQLPAPTKKFNVPKPL